MPRLYNRYEFLERRRLLRQQSSKAERILWERLRARRFLGLKWRRQHGLGSYIADFYCPSLRLVIEVDGPHHLTPRQAFYDHRRTRWIETLHMRVVRLTADEVAEHTDVVMDKLRTFITSLYPSSHEGGTGH